MYHRECHLRLLQFLQHLLIRVFIWPSVGIWQLCDVNVWMVQQPAHQRLNTWYIVNQKAKLKTSYDKCSRNNDRVALTQGFQHIQSSGVRQIKRYLVHQKHFLLFQTMTSKQIRCFSEGSPSPLAGELWVRGVQGRSSAFSVWEVWRAAQWQVWWPHWSYSPRTEARTGERIPQPGTGILPERRPTCTAKQSKAEVRP